jgi:hypothetical protein
MGVFIIRLPRTTTNAVRSKRASRAVSSALAEELGVTLT